MTHIKSQIFNWGFSFPGLNDDLVIGWKRKGKDTYCCCYFFGHDYWHNSFLPSPFFCFIQIFLVSNCGDSYRKKDCHINCVQRRHLLPGEGWTTSIKWYLLDGTLRSVWWSYLAHRPHCRILFPPRKMMTTYHGKWQVIFSRKLTDQLICQGSKKEFQFPTSDVFSWHFSKLVVFWRIQKHSKFSSKS